MGEVVRRDHAGAFGESVGMVEARWSGPLCARVLGLVCGEVEGGAVGGVVVGVTFCDAD